MIIRQIKKSHWERVYRQITTYGRAAPLSLQFDININCNGIDYILKVQPISKQKIAALQAVAVYSGCKDFDSEGYRLIKDNAVLSALLEILIYRDTDKRGQ